MTKLRPNDQQKLILAGREASRLFDLLGPHIKEGNRPVDLEKLAREAFNQSGMKPAFLGFKGYPATICVSVNSTIVHGVPSNEPFQVGDIVSVDLGVDNDGALVDAARTWTVGAVSPTHKRLVATADAALQAAVNLVRPGLPINHLGRAIGDIVTANGFFVVSELTGHGIGSHLQEPPSIYNYYRPSPSDRLKIGQALAIEPIISVNETYIKVAPDGFTIKADPPSVCAHVEDTVLVTSSGHLVVTRS